MAGIADKLIDRRARRARVDIDGDTFRLRFETEWSGMHRGVYPKNPQFNGVDMPCLKFGFSNPWDWILDLAVEETEAGPVVVSQGFQDLKGGRIPYQQTRRFFWRNPDMLYEVTHAHHMPKSEYVIAGMDPSELKIDPLLNRACYTRDGVTVCWQFSPMAAWSGFRDGGWVFKFETSEVEVLVTWGKGPASARFESISSELNTLRVVGPNGAREFPASELHQCIEPGERLVLPDGEVAISGVSERSGSEAVLKTGLWDMAVRRIDGGTVQLGSARVFAMDGIAESDSFPMLKPYLVRAVRSLKERMVFGVVPEDDPTQMYQWGTGTWPRCFAVLSLDYFGFHEDAYDYLQFMFDASRQFIPFDGHPHLWDNFYITGERLNERLYDINGHSMKLYEAGKFFVRHRNDDYGKRLVADHYETLKGWCSWIEAHLEDDGAVLDETESNVWAHGYGTFSQAPAAAGVKLFTDIARAVGRTEDAEHFSSVVDKLMNGLNTRLYGDAANPYMEIPEGLGNCYVSCIPQHENQRNWWDQPVQRIGISCYSLAANFFLQDPDVALLAADDSRAAETLDLALKHLGDPFDERIVTWHIRRKEAHLGYGQGQLLMALVYAGRGDVFRDRLQALFDVAKRETGDIYLMQEVLARPGLPNRGNKAALAYYPILIAFLAGIPSGTEPLIGFVPDLIVRSALQ